MTDSSNATKPSAMAKRNQNDSARTRRRERRKEERRLAEAANAKTPMTPNANTNSKKKNKNENRPIMKRSSLTSACGSISSDATSVTEALSACDDSTASSTCSTPEPKRKTTAQHENLKYGHKKQLKQCRSNKKTGRKSRSKKQQKPSPSKLTVEVEDITDAEKARYVAIDCEMVGVGPCGYRSALARVSIVNWEGDVIIDKHVKVEEEVTDYRTFVSGITEADLQSDDALSFGECRALVLDTLQEKIVVGHALKNDFDALCIHHEWHMIRDTARYEPFMKAHPTEEGVLIAKKLKDLSRDKLGLVIQEDGKEHDSIEDATAAMELYIKHRRKWDKAVAWKVGKTEMILEQERRMMYEMYISNAPAVSYRCLFRHDK